MRPLHKAVSHVIPGQVGSRGGPGPYLLPHTLLPPKTLPENLIWKTWEKSIPKGPLKEGFLTARFGPLNN